MANDFDIASFKKECTWYAGKSTKKLLDGYRIFPNDPHAEENALIEKMLNETWNDMRKWQPMIDALPQEKRIRFVKALFVHLAMMGAGEHCTPAEVKALNGESSMNYDLKLSHFIRDYSKEWMKGEIPFTETDLADYVRLLTYLNFNATDTATFSTDIIQRHNQFPFKQFFKHVARYVKKNREAPVLTRSLRDFRASLKWHADKRDSQEQALARDLIDKTDAVLRPK
jgi:hypothetical protein